MVKTHLRSLLTMASTTALAFGAVLVATPVASIAQTALTIESWRNDDIDIWNEKIIPAFNEKHPDIKVVFSPTPPADYNASLNAKLAGGTAGDLITCRPFDASLGSLQQGSPVAFDWPLRYGELFRRRQERMADRRRRDDLLLAHGLGHPWLHLQQGDLRGAQSLGPQDDPRVYEGGRNHRV